MIYEVFMPALSSTMTEGKIVSWVKSQGDKVEKGETVVVVESDKADMDVESFYEGYLGAIIVPAGETAPVGEAIALIAETEAELEAAQQQSQSKAPPRQQQALMYPPLPQPQPPVQQPFQPQQKQLKMVVHLVEMVEWWRLPVPASWRKTSKLTWPLSKEAALTGGLSQKILRPQPMLLNLPQNASCSSNPCPYPRSSSQTCYPSSPSGERSRCRPAGPPNHTPKRRCTKHGCQPGGTHLPRWLHHYHRRSG